MRCSAFLICLHSGGKFSGRRNKQWHGLLINGSLCRVRDPSEAAKDHRGGGGSARQVAVAGEPLLQQPPHLRRLHHHQPMGRHGRSLCAQVRRLYESRLPRTCAGHFSRDGFWLLFPRVNWQLQATSSLQLGGLCRHCHPQLGQNGPACRTRCGEDHLQRRLQPQEPRWRYRPVETAKAS